MSAEEIVRDFAVVCKCRGVRHKTIRLAILAGAHTLEAIRTKTTANTGCGNLCCDKILEMISRYGSSKLAPAHPDK